VANFWYFSPKKEKIREKLGKKHVVFSFQYQFFFQQKNTPLLQNT
jgi:hypothetical protein